MTNLEDARFVGSHLDSLRLVVMADLSLRGAMGNVEA